MPILIIYVFSDENVGKQNWSKYYELNANSQINGLK